jgi:hypothetical protein
MKPDDGSKFIHGKPTDTNTKATKFWESVAEFIAKLDVNEKPGLEALKKRTGTGLHHFFKTVFKNVLPKERVEFINKLKVKDTFGRLGEEEKQLLEGDVLKRILLGRAPDDGSPFILGAVFKDNPNIEKFWTNIYSIIQKESGDDEGLVALRKRSSPRAIAQFFHKAMLESGKFEPLRKLW